MLRGFPKSFSFLEEVIVSHQEIDQNTCRALVNLYKQSAEEYKKILQRQFYHNQDALSDNKQLLYSV